MRYLFYSLPVITFMLPLGAIWFLWLRLRMHKRTINDLFTSQQSNVRLTLHLDHLMRHFHIHGQDVPYVADSQTPGAAVTCWHCHAQRGHGHSAKCPYGYVQSHFTFDANGRPILRG